MIMQLHTTIPLAILLVSLASLWSCKEKYVSPYKAPVTGYLVVEGYIAGNNATRFKLSRTIQLPGNASLPAETGATLEIRGTDHSNYPLTERAGGVYSTTGLPLNPAVGDQVPSDYVYKCAAKDIRITTDTTSITTYFGSVYTPIGPSDINGIPVWLANYTDCPDCTTHGGTNHAPSFWPN